jgi:hypothetical protein
MKLKKKPIKNQGKKIKPPKKALDKKIPELNKKNLVRKSKLTLVNFTTSHSG